MKTRWNQDFKKRAIMLLGVFSFVFHSLVPFIAHTASASTDNGYMTTICTTYGLKTVFVNFDENQPQENKNRHFDCPHCVIQSNASGWMASYSFTLEPQILPLDKSEIAPTSSIPKTSFSRHFLSRAPPASSIF